MNCLSAFDRFAGLALKGLSNDIFVSMSDSDDHQTILIQKF